MRAEIKSLKEDYKQCMEALMKETYDKNKAEILCKVLKEKIETEKELSKSAENSIKEVEAEKSESEMSVDEDDWKKQINVRKNKQRTNKHT